MTNLMQASTEWSTRPDDERFWNLSEMYSSARNVRHFSTERNVQANDCHVILDDKRGLVMTTGDGDTADISNYAFGQVCRQYDAPTSFLRTLSPELAVDCLAHAKSKKAEDDRDRTLLLDTRGPDRPRLRATTSTKYSRVWNHEIINGLMSLEAEGWKVPPARRNDCSARFRHATINDCIDYGGDSPLTVKPGDEIMPSGLYASDHDMFAFMIHPDVVIDNGLSPSGMRRGTMISQSEVGAGSIWKMDFLFDTVCGNHIVWGATNVKQTRVRHLGQKVESNWVAMVREIGEDCQASAHEQEADIRRAQQVILGDSREEVMDLLFKKRWLGKRAAGAAYDLAAEHTDVHGDPRSAWGMVSGITRMSQATKHTDKRTQLDRAAGKMLATVLA